MGQKGYAVAHHVLGCVSWALPQATSHTKSFGRIEVILRMHHNFFIQDSHERIGRWLMIPE